MNGTAHVSKSDGQPCWAAFFALTGEIYGTGRTEDEARAAAVESEDASLGELRGKIEYEVWRCSRTLYDKVEREGGDIGYDHWRGTLVTHEEARTLAAEERSAL